MVIHMFVVVAIFVTTLPVAERKGFEPLEVLPSLVFKTSALNRSATFPYGVGSEI